MVMELTRLTGLARTSWLMLYRTLGFSPLTFHCRECYESSSAEIQARFDVLESAALAHGRDGMA